MEVPFSVGKFLFSGISKQIETTKERIERFKSDGDVAKIMARNIIDEDIRDLSVAIEFYAKNVIVSSKHLEKEFNELQQTYKAVMGS